MEIGLREWLIIGGAVIVLLIVIDGWRRMRGARNQLRMDIQQLPADMVEPVVDEINPELPNGGARRLCGETAGSSVAEPATAPVVGSAVADVPAPAPAEAPLTPLQPPAHDSGVVIASAAGEDVSERCEPTLDLSSLTLSEEKAAPEPACPTVAADDLLSTDDQEVPTALSEPMVEKHAASVVEEEIMTSAALFEAIEQSRQKRSAVVVAPPQQEPEPEQPTHVEASTADTAEVAASAETMTESRPAPGPDPLLRPLPGVETDPIAAIQATESVKPIYLHDNEPSADPLMRGVEDDDDLDILEPAENVVEPGAVDDTLFDSVESESASTLAVVEPRAEALTSEPQFISDIIDGTTPIVAVEETSVLASTEALDTDIELELPAEFEPQTRPEPSVISFAAVREAAGRTETVVAFPDKKEKPAPPEIEEPSAVEPEPEVQSKVDEDSDESAGVVEVTDASGDPRSDMMVQGGSLRQQPDPANVLVMTVVANGPEGFDGKLLLQLVLACGMRFGEMDIFHRFEDGIDSGAVQFSMANATGTGVFDIDTMDALNTRAVSFFMSMEEPREVMNALECMLATAETVASHMKGELVDDNRLLMRPQTQEHYRQRVRDFEMRNLRRRSG